MLIVTRNFDLSVGSAVALVGVILALLTVQARRAPRCSPCSPRSPAALLMGAWQGLWVTRVGVSSFIVTLAGMLYFRGISMIATNGATVAPLPRSLTGFATGFLPPPAVDRAQCSWRSALYAGLRVAELRAGAGARRRRPSCGADLSRSLAAGAGRRGWPRSGSRRWQGIPYLVLLVALCALAAEFVMRRTRFGAQLYAIGGNPEAARLSGINVAARRSSGTSSSPASATASPASR